MRIPFPALLLFVATAACQSADQEPDRTDLRVEDFDDVEWAGIAGIAGNDMITRVHVHNLLLHEGIDNYSEGSVVYGVAVPASLADRARGVLIDDPAVGTYWIEYFDELGDRVSIEPEPNWIEYRLDRADDREMLAQDDALSAAIARLQGEETVAALGEDAHKQWFLASARPYVDADGEWATGYEIEYWVQTPGETERSVRMHNWSFQVAGEVVARRGGQSFETTL